MTTDRAGLKLVTFTPREAHAISYYLQRVIPRGKEEEQELVKIIKDLQKLLTKV